MFQVITDTSANLPSELLRINDITCIPFPYFVNGARHTCLDTEGFDGETFYGAMREGAEITTSQINPQNYIEVMKPILQKGLDILFVGMSSGISGSYHCAEIAAEELGADFPDRRIRLVDTLGASLGEGLLVLRAVKDKLAGMSLDSVYEKLMDLRHRLCNIFTVDDLKYLRKGGRLSNLSFIVGTLLQIKPLLKGNEEGKIVAFAKLRGRKKALEELAKRYDEYVVDAEDQTIGIAHADCPQDAEYLASLLRRNHPPKDILTVGYEPVTGSHVGPGTLALFFEARSGCRAM
ncbi:MAG: DegV family protein [Oscillospiraceae bacterium]|nr:DegV family protein [Oscillospiraceae bacterium]